MGLQHNLNPSDSEKIDATSLMNIIRRKCASNVQSCLGYEVDGIHLVTFCCLLPYTTREDSRCLKFLYIRK
jgi:hypothetical protein